MLKLLGSALVAAGALWAGVSATQRLRRKLEVLEQLCRGLEQMEGEMALSCPELEGWMARLAATASGAAGELFAAFGASLARLGEKRAALLWGEAVEGIAHLDREGRDILIPLGEFLGRYEGEEQCRAIRAVRARLEGLYTRQSGEYRERSRLCRVLSLSGGAFLVILLL